MSVFIPLIKEVRWVKWHFLTGMLLLCLASMLNQLAPLRLQLIIDGPLTTLGKGQSLEASELLSLMAIYLLFVLSGSVVNYLAKRLLAYCANKIASLQRQKAYQVMQGLPISYFDDKPAGKIATRIVNDTETLSSQFYGALLSNIIVIVMQVVFIYGVIFKLNWQVGMALLGLIPIFYAWQQLYQSRTSQLTEDFYEARSELNTLVNETMNGSEILQLFDQEESLNNEFQTIAYKMRTADYQLTEAYATVSWSLSELIKDLVVTAVLAFVGYQLLGGQLQTSVGLLFIYVAYVRRLFEYLGSLVRQLPNLQRSKETGRRVLELLSQETEEEQTAELQVSKVEVVFDEVNFSYVTGKPVLKGISFKVREGERLALVGHTGSGKSSIMNLLYRFYEVDSGAILLDGQDISQYSRESLRCYMGIVLQDPISLQGRLPVMTEWGGRTRPMQKCVRPWKRLVQVLF